MAAFESIRFVRAARGLRASLVVPVAMVLVSVVLLYLWPATPVRGTWHGTHDGFAGAAVRSVVFLAAWILMSAVMMLPSAMPLLVSLDRMSQGQSGRRDLPAVAALAYLAVWAGVGVIVLIVTTLSNAYLLPRASPRAVAWLGGGSLVLAGVYGLSPLASACLRACRRPFGFLARYWRGGCAPRAQAARIGAAYGVSCVGCCVPMIGIMFVVGMANIGMVIALGAVMTMVKSTDSGARLSSVLSLALIGVGLAVGFAWLPLSPHLH